MWQRSARTRASRRMPPLSRLTAVVLAALLLCTASPSAHALLFARQPPTLTLALAAAQCIVQYQDEVLAPAVARALGVGAQACLRPADVLDERAAKRGVWRVHMPPLHLLWSPLLQLHAVTAGALHACCVFSFVLKGAQRSIYKNTAGGVAKQETAAGTTSSATSQRLRWRTKPFSRTTTGSSTLMRRLSGLRTTSWTC